MAESTNEPGRQKRKEEKFLGMTGGAAAHKTKSALELRGGGRRRAMRTGR